MQIVKVLNGLSEDELTKDDAVLLALISGAGAGKSRILEELHCCGDIPRWATLAMLDLGKDSKALQVRPRLALLSRLPISHVSRNSLSEI